MDPHPVHRGDPGSHGHLSAGHPERTPAHGSQDLIARLRIPRHATQSRGEFAAVGGTAHVGGPRIVPPSGSFRFGSAAVGIVG